MKKYVKTFENFSDERKGIVYEVNDIIYDGDEDDDLSGLPTTLEIFVPVEYLEDNYDLEEYISDEISNQTGFTHNGFTISVK